MSHILRPSAVIAAAIVLITSLGCSGLKSAVRDATLETLENDKTARDAFEKGVKEAVGAMCKKTTKGKGKGADALCECAGETFLKDKSIEELYYLFENLEGKDAQRELKRVTKACM